MNDITFNLLKIVVSVCAALIAYYLIPILKNKVEDDKYAQLLDLIDIAVRAAEQTVKGSGMGNVKKEYVISAVTEWMNKAGINITDAELTQLIEAAVFTMNRERDK